MSADANLVSKEDHEIKYLLRKWKKKQSNKNMKILTEKLAHFKTLPKYKPHNRENFYKYINDFGVLDLLEDLSDKEKKGGIFKLSNIIIFIVILLILLFVFLFISSQMKNDKTVIAEEKIEKTEKIEKAKPDLKKLRKVIKENTPIYFIPDSDSVLQDNKVKIKNILDILKRYDDIELLLEGHTASIGLPENEYKLSVERAKIVKERLNIDGANIKVKGYGGTKEAVKNADREERKYNRRVEIKIQ